MSAFRSRPTRDRERGFTMVELVVAIAILGIISTTLGVVGTVMFKTLRQTQDRLEESRGPRYASVYWVPDVASTETVNPGPVCGAAGPLVTLRWNDDLTGLTTVSYAIDTATPGQRKLVRRLCTNGATTPTAPNGRTTTIAPSLATSGTAVTCGNGTTYSACSSPDTDKSLLLTIALTNGGTFSVDAIREVT